MNVFRFVAAFVAVIVVALVAALLSASIEPDEPPHAAHLTGAGWDDIKGYGSEPGSNIEGLLVVSRITSYIGGVQRAEAARAVVPPVEVSAVVARPPATNTASETVPAVPSTGDSDWDYQAMCETGGDWSMQGSTYSGGLGFLNSTWSAYGGEEFASNAGLATREQQITVAERIQPSPPSSPERGCSGW